MPPERTRLASLAEWDQHKGIIRKIYIDDNSTVDEVREEMKVKHGFVASKSRYEKMLRDWNIRKNLSSDEWPYVLSEIRKRGVKKKLSEVTLYNKVVTTEQIRKAQSRYSISELRDMYQINPKRNTPAGISVYTPGQESLQHINVSPLLLPVTPDIPECQQSQINQSASGTIARKKPAVGSDISLEGICAQKAVMNQLPSRGFASAKRKDLPFIEFVNYFDALKLDENPSLLFGKKHMELTTLALPSAETSAADVATLFDCNSITSSDTYEYMLENPLFTESPYVTTSFSTCFLPEHHPGRNIDAFDELEWRKQELQNRLLDMPERTSGENAKVVQLLLGAPQPQSPLCLLKVAVYLHSNGPYHFHMVESAVMKWIVNNIPLKSIKSLFDAGLPTLEAFKFQLLKAGLTYGRVDLVNALLDMDQRLRKFLFHSSYLVGTTIRGGNIDMVRFLVHSGIDVRRFEIENSCSLLKDCRVVPVAQFLIAAGADVQFGGNIALKTAIAGRNKNMVKHLISVGADVNTNLNRTGDDCGVIALSVAIRHNDVELLLLLLKKNVKVDQVLEGSFHSPNSYSNRWVKPYRGTALQVATKAGHVEIVEALLDNGANINASAYGAYGTTALLAAVQNAHIKVVQLLLDRGAKIDAPGTSSKYPYTALLAAVEMKHFGLVQMLLSYKASPNSPSFGSYGTTVLEAMDSIQLDQPLISSIESAARNAEIQDSFLNSHLKHHYMRTQLFHAIQKTDFTRIKQLVAAGVKIDMNPMDEDDWIPMQFDFEGQDFKLLWSRPQRKTHARSTILHLAITSPENQNLAIFRYLLEHMQSSDCLLFNTAWEPLLRTAVLWNRVEIAEYLLDFIEVDINCTTDARISNEYSFGNHSFDHPVVYIAAARGKLKMLTALIARGANINYVSQMGDILQISLRTYNSHIASYLLDCGVNSNGPAIKFDDNQHRLTTLGLAVRVGEVELINHMLAKGVDVNYRPNDECETALQTAVQKGKLEIVKLLLDHKADVNALPPTSLAKSTICLTALQEAAFWGRMKIAQLLLDSGAKVNMTSGESSDNTALEWAAGECELDMVQLLINAGADDHLPLNKKYVKALREAKSCYDSPNLGVIALLENYREEAMEQWNSLRILEMVSEDEDMVDS